MQQFLTFTVLGLVFGAIYAIAASGLVITYATSNVFNMAHGAIGMVMAFVYWELSVVQGLPTLVAVVLTLAIAAASGALLERILMRRLVDADVTVSLTVTVGLLVFLIGVAQTIWPPEGRRVAPFFEGEGVQVFGLFVTAHQIVIFVLAGLVALGIYLLLNRTRTGVAMRAIVDNRTLLALHGAKPARLSMLSWAIGSSLAALAGILLVSDTGLDYTTLTFLVISAYAAAVVGRLKSLPLTFAGAMGLGLAQNYVTWATNLLPELPESVATIIGGFRSSLPTLLLFAVMLVLPHEKLRVGKVEGASLTDLPSRRKAVSWGGVLLVAVVALTFVLGVANTFALGRSLALAAIMLSLVLLAGYGGDVSLGQMTFVGVGALVVAKIGVASPQAIVVGALAAGVVGLIIGIPALRLRGLYLGLATLAFALAMDKMFFNTDFAFKFGGQIEVDRPAILGMSLQSEQAWTIFTALMFVVMGIALLEFRRSRFGRLLLATRDSQAACGTLGLSITRTRVMVFVLSASMAGLAGGLLSGMSKAASANEYQLLQSLPLLLLAVVGGITSVTGALLGGLFLGLGNTLTDLVSGDGGGSVFLGTGLAAMVIGFNPNGVAGQLFGLAERLNLPGRSREPEVVALEDEADDEVVEVSAVGTA